MSAPPYFVLLSSPQDRRCGRREREVFDSTCQLVATTLGPAAGEVAQFIVDAPAMREIAHAAVVARERLKTGSVADAAEVIDAGLTRAFPLIFIADDETMPANPDSVIEWFARNYSAVAAGQP